MTSISRRCRIAALAIGFAGIGTTFSGAAQDSGWPREFTTAKGNSVVVYQPQIETFTGNAFTARSAVSVMKKDDATTKFGVVFFTARASVDRDARTVSVLSVKVNRVRFPNITPEKEKNFSAILEEEFPKWNVVISYDRVLESLHTAEREKQSAAGLKHDPPKILIAEEPTVLVTFDGEPAVKDVEGAPLKVVVNTPFLMVLDGRDNQYYLSGGAKWWYRSSSPKGPWQPIAGPPSEIAEMKAKADAQVKSDPSATKDDTAGDDDDGTSAARPPKILVATLPSELIVCEGKPAFKSVLGTDLLYLSNSESDVVMDTASQTYFALLSGRWFKSKTLVAAAWAYVPPDALPPSFSKIPPDSDLGDVLASVPGTDEAEDAVLDAQIPQTTAVKRSEAKLDVKYDGEAQFVGVEGTNTEYAVNTATSVLKIRGRYYACENAVWFVADSPDGPWLLADEIPRDDIDALPPSVPVYNTKYVQIYDATPDDVTVGYTPGYTGCYPWYGTVVWGTGWNYRPWFGPVFYWPRPYTWGFHAHYSPWAGWGFGSSWSYPFFSFSRGWGGAFRPVGWGSRPGYWGGGWRRPGWWGPGGYRPPINVVNNIHMHNPNWNQPGRPGYTRSLPGVRPGTNVLRPIPGSRPNIGFRPTPTAKAFQREGFASNNLYRRIPEKAREMSQPVTPGTPRSTGRQNNVYADKNGEVYRRNSDGGWQQRDNNGWRTAGGQGSVKQPVSKQPSIGISPKPSTGTPMKTIPGRSVSRPAPNPGLSRDFSARQRGESRVRESRGSSGGSNSGSNRSSSGSSRSSGSSSHGGGGKKKN